MIETLESRRHLDASVSLTARGTLLVRGTSEGDTIHVEVNGDDRYQVTNGRDVLYTAPADATVRRIEIDAGGGNDTVVVRSAVNRPAVVNAGNGRDRISVFNDRTTVSGGAGNDVILGPGVQTERNTVRYVYTDPTAPLPPEQAEQTNYGYDTAANAFYGNGGNDTLATGVGGDSIFGGGGDDKLVVPNDNLTVRFTGTPTAPLRTVVFAEEIESVSSELDPFLRIYGTFFG